MQREGDSTSTIEGYLLIPHELLHVAAYRLIAKPCAYQWGQRSVRRLAPLTRRERLFVLLFPLAVTWGIAAMLFGLFLLEMLYLAVTQPVLSTYWRSTLLYGNVGLIVLIAPFVAYGGASTADIYTAWRLLSGQGAQDRQDEREDPQTQADDH